MKPASDRFKRRLRRRRRANRLFRMACLAATCAGVAFLLMLLANVALAGLPWLSTGFLTSFPSRVASRAGVLAALHGTFWIMLITAGFAIPVGTAAAVYLEEYGSRGRLGRLVEVNIANLAGVPSIVYGLLGLAIFVRGMHLGRSLTAGGLTMGLLILPVIIMTAREAIRAVPPSLRHAALALGASRWQTVRHHVLPAALPGLLTGVILSMSRAIGETAPLLMIGALSYVAFVPTGPMDEFTVLPIQIFNWISRPQAEFHGLAAAGILVLLAGLLLMNAIAVTIRQWAQGRRT